jgi:D-alanine-D-alanine ligase
MKKIALLYNLNRNENEYETEFDSELTINSLYNALKKNYEIEKVEAVRDFSWINKLNDIKPNLVFNICEGFNGPARESVYASILEQLGYNYSGPDSTNLLICHNKFLVKNLVKDYILTPFGYLIKNQTDINKLNNIKFPVIVKLNSEGSSMGMNRKSIVNNYADLKKQVTWLQNKYKRNILVEEFIEGQDISMIYVEGLGALGPCVINCDSKFYDYEMKTIKDKNVDISEALGNYKELKEIVEMITKRLDIKGYAKIDFRVKNNQYYLIEVNAQVSFHPTGEFMTCAKKDSYDFNKIINYIVNYAIKNDYKENSVGIGDVNE